MNFLRWLGTEEAQQIQSSYGAAISAYEGCEDEWVAAFDQFDYKLNVQACVDMFDYSVQSVNDATRPVWKSKVSDELLRIYSGEVSVDDGLKNMNDAINSAIAEG
jgi:multiple sugar transport system substrate-binding protein